MSAAGDRTRDLLITGFESLISKKSSALTIAPSNISYNLMLYFKFYNGTRNWRTKAEFQGNF